MIFVIICLLISFYFVAQYWIDTYNSIGENICATILIPFLGIGVGLILWISIGFIIGLFMPTIDVKELADTDSVDKVVKTVKESIYKDATSGNNMKITRRR